VQQLPIFLRLQGRPCLVVGGGPVAARKAELLVAAGALTRVVAEHIGAALGAWAATADGVVLEQRRYESRDLLGVVLVIAATDRPEVNAAISAEARARGIPINVVDAPELCDFFMPSIVDRDPVVVAVGTGGASPVLARLTRARLEAVLHPQLGRLADFAGRMRGPVAAAFPELGPRRRVWEQVFDGELAEQVLAGDSEGAERRLRQQLAGDAVALRPVVSLIATGDGDPERLSLGALRRLGAAEVVLHDAAIPAAIVALARRDAERRLLPTSAVTPGDLAPLWTELASHLSEGVRLGVLICGDPFASVQGLPLPAEARAGAQWELLRPAP